jgi:hypothetical protein
MVCLGNICINTLQKGAKDDDDYVDDDNNHHHHHHHNNHAIALRVNKDSRLLKYDLTAISKISDTI